MRLPFYQEWTEDEKKIDLVSLMNHNFYRDSVGFQRLKLKEILKNSNYSNKIVEGRLSKKKYYELLRNSKISVGAYGWGEVCYREFEAVTCGAAFMTADMSNIETWPNIYHEGETYLSYDFDFKNLNANIEILLRNPLLRKKLVENSRKVLEDCHLFDGKNYFINKILEIIS